MKLWNEHGDLLAIDDEVKTLGEAFKKAKARADLDGDDVVLEQQKHYYLVSGEGDIWLARWSRDSEWFVVDHFDP